MKKTVQFLLLMLPLTFAVTAAAQQQVFTINPSSSSIAFGLIGTGHEVHGTFHVSSGAVDFDRALQTASGSIVVSALSGESGDNGRDKKMRADVLDVEHYAEVTFQPQSYQGTIAATGDSSIQVSGIFTLHGTPHPITVPMQIHIEGGNMTAKGGFVVPYVKWGLKDPSIFILKVAKDVHIDLNLAGTLAPKK